MSSSRSPRFPEAPSLNATRQMLDELDALMERMLALPVNELEEAPVPRVDPPQSSLLTAHLTMLEPPAPTEDWPLSPAPPVAAPPEAEEEIFSEIIATRITIPSFADKKEPPWQEFEAPAPEPSPAAPEALPVAPAGVEKDDLLPPPTPVRSSLLLSRGSRSRPRWRWQPIFRTNQAFDHWTQPLGRFGSWLRSSWGRNLLGLAGLALLVLSFLWLLLDWSYWTW